MNPYNAGFGIGAGTAGMIPAAYAGKDAALAEQANRAALASSDLQLEAARRQEEERQMMQGVASEPAPEDISRVQDPYQRVAQERAWRLSEAQKAGVGLQGQQMYGPNLDHIKDQQAMQAQDLWTQLKLKNTEGARKSLNQMGIPIKEVRYRGGSNPGYTVSYETQGTDGSPKMLTHDISEFDILEGLTSPDKAISILNKQLTEAEKHASQMERLEYKTRYDREKTERNNNVKRELAAMHEAGLNNRISFAISQRPISNPEGAAYHELRQAGVPVEEAFAYIVDMRSALAASKAKSPEALASLAVQKADESMIRVRGKLIKPEVKDLLYEDYLEDFSKASVTKPPSKRVSAPAYPTSGAESPRAATKPSKLKKGDIVMIGKEKLRFNGGNDRDRKNFSPVVDNAK